MRHFFANCELRGGKEEVKAGEGRREGGRRLREKGEGRREREAGKTGEGGRMKGMERGEI